MSEENQNNLPPNETDKQERIRLIRLVTGEDLLAVVNTWDDAYGLKNALRIMVQQTPDGRLNVGLVSWPHFTPANRTKRNITISRNNVLYMDDPDDQLVSAYRAQTSGLLYPSTGAPKVKLV